MIIASKECFNSDVAFWVSLHFSLTLAASFSFLLSSLSIRSWISFPFYYRDHIFIHLCLGHQTGHQLFLWYGRIFSKASRCFCPASCPHRGKFTQPNINRVHRTSPGLSTSVLTSPLWTKRWRLAMCTASVRFPGLRIPSPEHSTNTWIPTMCRHCCRCRG